MFKEHELVSFSKANSEKPTAIGAKLSLASLPGIVAQAGEKKNEGGIPQ